MDRLPIWIFLEDQDAGTLRVGGVVLNDDRTSQAGDGIASEDIVRRELIVPVSGDT